MTDHTTRLLQLRISLQDVEPVVWRRILVPDDIDFGRLAQIILIAMGWGGGHLHLFQVGHDMIGDPQINDGMDNCHNEYTTYLYEIIGSRKKKFRFEYDFGDDWQHKILIEKRLPDDGLGVRVLEGENACPPEDCGGAWGYANLLEIMADENHPEFDEMCDWLGDDTFDPTLFDLKNVQKVMKAHFNQ